MEIFHDARGMARQRASVLVEEFGKGRIKVGVSRLGPKVALFSDIEKPGGPLSERAQEFFNIEEAADWFIDLRATEAADA